MLELVCDVVEGSDTASVVLVGLEFDWKDVESESMASTTLLGLELGIGGAGVTCDDVVEEVSLVQLECDVCVSEDETEVYDEVGGILEDRSVDQLECGLCVDKEETAVDDEAWARTGVFGLDGEATSMSIP